MSNIVNEFRAELASAHLQAQVGRFVRLAVVTFGAQLAALGTGHLSRDALAGVAVGAVEAAYRQWAPVVPWAAIAARLHLLAAPQPDQPESYYQYPWDSTLNPREGEESW